MIIKYPNYYRKRNLATKIETSNNKIRLNNPISAIRMTAKSKTTIAKILVKKMTMDKKIANKKVVVLLQSNHKIMQ